MKSVIVLLALIATIAFASEANSFLCQKFCAKFKNIKTGCLGRCLKIAPQVFATENMETESDNGARLTESQAKSLLAAAGIPVKSSGNCFNKNNGKCTGLDTIRANTINGLIALKKASGCAVTMTGGTEIGHSTRGTMTHSTGYKVDFSLSTCLDTYIKTKYRNGGVRGDGATKWVDATGNVIAREGNHWDATFL